MELLNGLVGILVAFIILRHSLELEKLKSKVKSLEDSKLCHGKTVRSKYV